MTEHLLKIWPEYFAALNDKPFEVRKNDRHFQKGDQVTLRVWHRSLEGFLPGGWGGAQRTFTVTYVLSDFPGLEPGYCVLGLADDVFFRDSKERGLP